MKPWKPHVTVACVVFEHGKYLIVEERDKLSGELVFSQPAGHLEQDETLIEAAHRETREETGWSIEITAMLGSSLYTAPSNNVTYLRTTFLAAPLSPIKNAVIDPDIYRVHWMDYEALIANSDRMRSPLVIACVERHRAGIQFPLDVIFSGINA